MAETNKAPHGKESEGLNNNYANNQTQENNTPFPFDCQDFEPDYSFMNVEDSNAITFQNEAEEKAYFKKEAQKKQSVNVVSISHLLKKKFPPKEYTIKPIIPVQGLVMLFAGRGIGKTQIGLNVAYAVACGGSFLNWRAEKARRVLYIDGEMPAQTMQDRLFYIVHSNEIEPQEGFFNLITPDLQEDNALMPNLATAEGQNALEPHLEGIEFVIIDNLATLARHGRSNDEESWTPVQEWILKLRRRGISVLLIHHASKNGSQRGTSAKEDILDTVIELKRPKDYETEQGARFEVHLTKARGIFGEEAEPFETQLSIKDFQAIWTVHKLKDVLVDKVQTLLGEGMKQREIAQELETSASSINRIIKNNNLVKRG